MPWTGLPNHLDLTVGDLDAAIDFYDLLLGRLGYVRDTDYAGDVPTWARRGAGAAFSIGLHRARNPRPHDRYSAGLHHLAFHVGSRAEVDALHAHLRAAGVRILDAPAEYDYTPGYYALFVADPDGLKLELVHEPRFDAIA